MGSVELYSFLRKSLGIIQKKLEEEGVLTLSVSLEHRFMPVLDVTDRETCVDVRGFVYKVKVTGDYPVYFNLDRPITDNEYAVVFPGSYIVVNRLANKLCLKAPTGYTTSVKVDVLRW